MEPSPDMAPPIINCHTHIFKGENVPPYIAKTFIPWPFYKLLTVPFILWICRGWYLNDNSPRQWKHKWWYKKVQRIVYTYRSFIKRYLATDLLIGALNIVIVWHALIFLGPGLPVFLLSPMQTPIT
jgi:hypothetical protein